MVQWLLSLPKNIFVVLVLGVAILFIVAQDPPHTICRTQIENFKSQQEGIIYRDPNLKAEIKKLPLLETLVKSCKKYNSPGSCYGLFSKIKNFIDDFKLVSIDCREGFASLSKVRSTLFEVYGLMIRIAWGQAPPTEYQDKLAWFTDVDLSLFCLIKKQILFFYGKSSLLNLERKVLKKLPGAKGMSEDSIRELALVSENCSHYPSL